MAQHHDTEAANEHMIRLISARTDAIEHDIAAGRMSVIGEVTDRLDGIEAGEDEAAALIRAAVIGRTAIVGVLIAAEVQHAIYLLAEELARGDMVDAERNRAESRGENLVHMVMADRVAA